MTASVATETNLAFVRSTPRTSHKLAHLQALRGIAATLVVLAHTGMTLAERNLVPKELAARLGNSGYFGVATFFIISGFIILKTSKSAFGDRAGAVDFVLKRLIRIFPIYWIATVLFALLSPHRGSYTASDLVASLLLIPHVVTGAADMHPLVGQGWTLQYEMLFYAVFAVGLFLTRRAGTIAIMGMLVALAAFGATMMPWSDLSEPMTRLAYWSRPIILLFVVGMSLGVLSERKPHGFVAPAPFATILGVLAVWLVYSLSGPLSVDDQLRFPAVLVVWGLCAVCVFVSVFGRSGEGLFESAAEAFGDASYSVYLFHTFVLSALLRLHVQEISPVLFVVATLVGANVLGLLIYRYVERPMLKTLRRSLLQPA